MFCCSVSDYNHGVCDLFTRAKEILQLSKCTRHRKTCQSVYVRVLLDLVLGPKYPDFMFAPALAPE